MGFNIIIRNAHFIALVCIAGYTSACSEQPYTIKAGAASSLNAAAAPANPVGSNPTPSDPGSAPVATPTPVTIIVATPTPAPTATATPAAAPVATATPTPDPTATPTATATPSATAAPTATATPASSPSGSGSGSVSATQLIKGDALAPATMRCALASDQGIYCWGGAVTGRADNSISQAIPALMSGFPNGATQVDGQGAHACAVDTSGSLLCWGYNEYKQSTPGNSWPLYVGPTAVALPNTAIKVAASANATCVIVQGATSAATDNRVMCWGKNDEGETGNGSIYGGSTPADVVGLPSGLGAIDIAAGSENFCAIMTDHSAYCWGNGAQGVLGAGPIGSYNGGPQVSPQALKVLGLQAGVAQISIGWSHTCALLLNGNVQCFGDNSSGELGIGTNSMDPNWTAVAPVSGIPTPILQVSAGMGYTCAVGADTQVYCWGGNEYARMGSVSSSSLPVAMPGLAAGVAEVEVGAQRTCARFACGQISCVGNNQFGNLGDGTTNNASTPVAALTFESANGCH